MLTWAEHNLTILDGTLQLRGVDLYERATQPLDRFVALLYALRMEGAAFADEDERKALSALLEWPSKTEKAALIESDAAARRNLEALGIDLPMIG